MNTTTHNKNYTLDSLAHLFASAEFSELEEGLKTAGISDEDFLEMVEEWINFDEIELDRLKTAFVKHLNNKADIYIVTNDEMLRLQGITKRLAATYKTQAQINQIENTFFDLQIRRDNESDSKRFRDLFNRVLATYQFDLFKRG
jgi:hypothetical protein